MPTLELKRPDAAAHERVSHRGAAVGSVCLALLGRTTDAVEMARNGFAIHLRVASPAQPPESQLIGSVLAHVAAGDLRAAEEEAAPLDVIDPLLDPLLDAVADPDQSEVR